MATPAFRAQPELSIMLYIVERELGLYICTTTHSEALRGGKGGRDSPGAESLWGRRIITGLGEKFQQCHQYFLQHHICFRKTFRFEHGAPNLLIAPGAI